VEHYQQEQEQEQVSYDIVLFKLNFV